MKEQRNEIEITYRTYRGRGRKKHYKCPGCGKEMVVSHITEVGMPCSKCLFGNSEIRQEIPK